MIRKVFTLVLLFCCLIITGQAQKASPIPDEVVQSVKARVDGGVNPGIVVGLIDDSGVHYYSYGLKSIDGKEPVDEHAVFEIGSISKTFTGILLAEMSLKGKVSLDGPLEDYIPQGTKAPTRNGRSITLVELSNHTSGLPRLPNNMNPSNPANPYADYSVLQLFAFLSSYELPRDIGSQYEYSNYAVGLLGKVLADKAGMSYEELMVKVIAEPLGMKDTRITFTPEMKKKLAMGHSGGMEVENWDIPTLAGAGAIRSTAEDMVKYISANMGREKTDLYPAMQLSHENTRKEGEQPLVGLGWHIRKTDGLEIVWHNGGTGGYRTFCGFVEGGNKGVVVLSNSDQSVDDIGVHLLDPSSPLKEVKPSIGYELRKVIEEKGIEAGVETYRQLKKEKSDQFDFGESELNNLGYYYLQKGEVEKAIAVFKLNVEAYPDAFNVYDSLGEAYMEQGDKEKAIANYKKSVELNPGNIGGIDRLKKLGVDTESVVKEVDVPEDILETYVGKYQLAPGFFIQIAREGKQLKGQATGQPQFDLFASSENVFYLKVVEAQVTFNKNAEGAVESLTLLQGGQEMPGKKVE